MAQFGECPNCGRMTLIKTTRRLGSMVEFIVRCVNCDFEKVIKTRYEDEDGGFFELDE